MYKKSIFRLLILQSVLFFCSCASYQQSTQEFRNSWDIGDEGSALVHLEKAGESIKAGHDEELLWNLEMASVARANRMNELSDIHIGNAKSIADEKFIGGAIKAKNKGLGEYVGHFYDRNMLEIYRALRALERGDNTATQSAFTELKFKRQEAKEISRKMVMEAEQDAIEKKDLKYKNFMESDTVQIGNLVDEELSKTYQDFYNPMGDYIRLVLNNRGGEQFDFGTTKKNLTDVLGSGKSFLRDEKKAGLGAESNTYVLMESGSAPYRVEEKFRLPLFLFYNGPPPGGVLYVPFALPRLQYRNDYDESASILLGSESTQMETLVDMDAVVSAEFKAKLPGQIAKALIQTTLAVASQVAIEAATKDQQQDSAAVMIFSAIAKVAAAEALTQADERSWYTLPKQVLVQKIKTPKNGSFSVQTGAGAKIDLQVNPQSLTNFVYLKSIRRGNPIKEISNFSFDQGIALNNVNETKPLVLARK
ncbi:hypothetical protein OAQ34_04770 [Opitutales bacterium]|nr:hypothetical protein [Opitutales bacterium]